MFKKLVRAISEIKTENDRDDCWAQIDRVFEAEKISFEDHEMLYNLTSMVNAVDPVDARNLAVQRLVDETGHGLDINEITDVHEVED